MADQLGGFDAPPPGRYLPLRSRLGSQLIDNRRRRGASPGEKRREIAAKAPPIPPIDLFSQAVERGAGFGEHHRFHPARRRQPVGEPLLCSEQKALAGFAGHTSGERFPKERPIDPSVAERRSRRARSG